MQIISLSLSTIYTTNRMVSFCKFLLHKKRLYPKNSHKVIDYYGPRDDLNALTNFVLSKGKRHSTPPPQVKLHYFAA